MGCGQFFTALFTPLTLQRLRHPTQNVFSHQRGEQWDDKLPSTHSPASLEHRFHSGPHAVPEDSVPEHEKPAFDLYDRYFHSRAFGVDEPTVTVMRKGKKDLSRKQLAERSGGGCSSVHS